MNRNIYKYNDGFSDVFGDPSEITYRFAIASETLDMEAIDGWMTLPRDDDGNVIESQVTPGDMMKFTEACHRLLPAIRAAFNVKEFDPATGQGLTMSELLELYADYMEWRLAIKKNTGELPTAATPTASAATFSETSQGPLPPPPLPTAAGAVKPPWPTQPPMGMSRRPNASTGSTSMPGDASPSPEPNSSKPTSFSEIPASPSMTRSRMH